ncbi:hypothetical protein [Burkholderia sp. BCC1630]|uniref:hypothetical protein n=1 Tax=Burkholderia sp. BCC1630 TaxID=2676304 RepID=UPI00158C9C12|nr:hypothetical protein [Burkholderia sp. BCC1630]
MNSTEDQATANESRRGGGSKGQGQEESWLERGGKIIALIASAALPASIVFDFGFYHTLGIDMRDVPTSLSDHARSAVVWLPLLIVSWTGILLFALFDHRMTRGMTQTEMNRSAPNPSRAERRSNRSWIWFRIACIFFAGCYVLFGGFYEAPAAATAVPLWVWFATWCMGHKNVEKRLSLNVQIAILTVPVCIALFFYYGHSEATKALKEKSSATLFFTGPEVPRAIPVTILRTMDKGVLVRIADSHIVFLQWSAVARIDSGPVATPFPGLLCTWFQWCAISRFLATYDQQTKADTVQ